MVLARGVLRVRLQVVKERLEEQLHHQRVVEVVAQHRLGETQLLVRLAEQVEQEQAQV